MPPRIGNYHGRPAITFCNSLKLDQSAPGLTCADRHSAAPRRLPCDGAGSGGARGARNGHATAPFTGECQSFLDNLIAGLGQIGATYKDAKVRQVDILVWQGQRLADAVRQVGVTEVTYHRWYQEFGGPKNNQAKRPKEPRQDTPKRIVERAVSVARDIAPQSKTKPDFTSFEE
jgi:hypothetical protein